MVAQNGKAVWTVIGPPEKLSKTPIVDLWHIYPLEPPFKDAVLDKLTSMASDAGRMACNSGTGGADINC
jgi:hypothetical protein